MPVTPLGQSLSDVSDNMSNFWKNASGNTFRDSQERLKARILANQLQEGMNPIQQRMAELGLLNEESASPANVLGNKIKTALLSNDYENGLDGLKANRALQQKLAGLTDESAINNIEATKDILPNLKRQQASNELATQNAIGEGAADTARLKQDAEAKKAEMESVRYNQMIEGIKKGGGDAEEKRTADGTLLGHNIYMPETGTYHFVEAPKERLLTQNAKVALQQKATLYNVPVTDHTDEKGNVDWNSLAQAVGEKAQSLSPERLHAANSLSKEWRAQPIYKDKQLIDEKLDKAKAALQVGEQLGNYAQTDQALQDILTTVLTGKSPTQFQYMKSKQYQPTVNKLIGAIGSIVKGGAGFTGEDRAAIISQIEGLAGAADVQYQKTKKQFERKAEAQGLNKDAVFGEDNIDPTPTDAASADTMPATPAPAKGGTQQIGRFKVTVH